MLDSLSLWRDTPNSFQDSSPSRGLETLTLRRPHGALSGYGARFVRQRTDSAARTDNDCLVRLVGYCPRPSAEILAQAYRGEDWTRLGGDFVLIADAGDDVHVVSSALATIPYFYAVDESQRFLHDSNVFRLARRLGEPWRWSGRALRCLSLFGHTLGTDTLHSRIFRVPPGAHLHWNGQELRQLASRLPPAWTDHSRGSNPSEALRDSLLALVRAFLELPDGPLVLSLSAGFDSRLLLALALRYRRPVRAVTLGFADSTDVIVAKQLASSVGLPITTVSLLAQDYLAVAREAVWRTGGTKTAENWHALVYPRRADISSRDVHVIGANGEFARTYLLRDQLAALGALPDEFTGASWVMRLARARARLHRAWRFIDTAGTASAADDLRYAMQLVPRQANVADRLDLFYALMRVRHFVGNGLALYAAHGQPCSPFLDGGWMDATLRVPRAQKLHGYYHRWAIDELAPSLSSLPFNGVSFASLGAAPKRTSPFRGYGAFDQAIELPSGCERLIEDQRLEQFLPRAARKEVVQRRVRHDMSLLWTLSLAAEWAHWAESDQPVPSFA